jgi:hypothetical protein
MVQNWGSLHLQGVDKSTRTGLLLPDRLGLPPTPPGSHIVNLGRPACLGIEGGSLGFCGTIVSPEAYIRRIGAEWPDLHYFGSDPQTLFSRGPRIE